MSLQKLVRAAAGVALLVPFATCSDFTGPKTSRGVRVPIAPTFSKSATFAKAVYSAAGIEFDRVRVLIVRGEVEVLKDTTVAFSPTSPDLTLPLTITANPGEVVTATLEYRSADIVLYSGSQSVTTVAIGATATAPTTPLVLVPVGPGSTAATVELSPSSGTFPVSSSVPFTATAFAADHSAIANAIFGWTVEDATVATVSSQGIVQPTSKGGVAKVRATTLNGTFAEASITFVTPPASLAMQSGGGQSAMALDALPAPVVVKVLDANGVAVPGATVTFAVATGGGSVTVVNGVSDASGLVSANWTLGPAVGTQSISATAAALPNSPITITAMATERPAKSLVFAQQPVPSLMNASITPPVSVKVLDDKGHEVAGYTGAVTIAFEMNPTSATLGGTLVVNAAAGIAMFSDLTVDKAGEGYTLKATASGLTAVVSDAFGISQVPSGLSLNAGGGQTAPINSTLAQIVVKVADASGAGVAGVVIAFEVVSGGGSIVVNNGTTDANGLARVTWTLGGLVGAQSIKATSGTLSGSPLTITATGRSLAPVGLAFVVQPSNVFKNAVMSPPVQVRIVDAQNNTVTSATNAVLLDFNYTGIAPDAGLSGNGPVNAVNGIATFDNLQINGTLSQISLKAKSTGLTDAVSNSFDVTPAPGVSRMWTGAASTNWSEPSNWSPAGTPAEPDSVTIVSATNQPVITTSAYAKTIVVQSGASLQIVTGSSYIMTEKVYNAGTLQLSAAFLFGSIENHNTVIVDSIGVANAFTNVGASSKLFVKSTKGGGAIFELTTGLTNEGQIQLDDTDGQDAFIYIVDSLVNKAGGTIAVNQGSGGGRDIQATLRNYGSITVASTNGLYLTPSTVGDSTINAGSIAFTGGGPFYMYFSDEASVFTNRSTGSISLGSSLWEVLDGKINLRQGTITGTGVLRSYYSALDIDFLNFASTFPLTLDIHSYTLFPGDSLNVPSGRTVKITESEVRQRATIRGTLRVISTTSSSQSYLHGGATIYAGGVLDVQGVLDVDSTFAIAASGKLTLNATGQNMTVTFDRPFTNNGQIEMTSTGGVYLPILRVEGTLTNASGATIGAYGGSGGERRIEATLSNQAGGTVYVEHDSYLRLFKGGVTHVNAGTIDIANSGTAGTGNETLYSFDVDDSELGATFTNSGTINVGANRTLYIGAGDTFNNTITGVVSGKGTIDVTASATTFTNAGTIRPGGQNAVGTMTYKGNWTAGSGTFEIEISGTTTVTHDVFQVTGMAKLGGTMKVIHLNGFTPSFGPAYPVLPAPSYDETSGFTFDPAIWGSFVDGGYHIVYSGAPGGPLMARPSRRPPV